MLGAIIGDIIGSRFEWHNIHTKDFDLFTNNCEPTDDSIMSIAIAKAFLDCKKDYSNLDELVIEYMREYGMKYPNAGYGGMFRQWLVQEYPCPYNSFGNGAAMRISPVGFVANSIEEIKELSFLVTSVTHDHLEGIKGAEAIAVAIFLARQGKSKEEIKEYMDKNYYLVDFELDDIRDSYKFDETCQGTVPYSLAAFYEAKDYEDTIRNAISIGGDSDTLACISGGIAEAYYGIPEDIREKGLEYLDSELKDIVLSFENKYQIKR